MLLPRFSFSPVKQTQPKMLPSMVAKTQDHIVETKTTKTNKGSMQIQSYETAQNTNKSN